MNIIIVGCGRVGAELAYRLYQKGHNISVIDHVASAFNNLPSDFRGRTIEGEVMNMDVLSRAGIDSADGLAAVTNSDPLNAVVAHLARSAYGVPNIVVRNYDPSLRVLHETFDLQVVSSSSWGAQRLEEMLASVNLRTVFSAGNGEVEIYEFSVPAAWDGATLGELLPATNGIIISVTRAGKAILPTPDYQIKTNDVILVSATFDGIEVLRNILHSRPEA